MIWLFYVRSVTKKNIIKKSNMKIRKDENGQFVIEDVTKDDLKSVHNVIMSSQLPDRRDLYGLKVQIEKVV